ncbi:MAG: nitronate monooxygenase [Candidatus Electrothrix sp. AW2]|jgi:NAD(P)H-dependent flavin oxidoreductase YrpB (nitropropane dioxygenase family)|nr:nitronate monooxygenase [Candidatus Electrothrix gigas]MCI5126949.1 nitronate monooxygenase [Candidatus Electrothrix gigas]MCI5134613.1 nitronate monooxygenase [Candidatus Electrothrix gigas]MCI5179195.1 nitronate monooxygenase [Candidatus Electrothrix gigas]MCI5183935.1 nitronate monooxygenase [Candidatus Electrothrix gigas]
MKLPELKIGSFTAKIPLIQGGMSIRVSTSALATPVAACGGIGTIGGSGIPVPELQEDIRKAKSATDGIIAVNIMYAMKNFHDLVMGSIEAGVDMIITGAGFSRDIFKIGKQYNTPIVSIVSSPSFARLAEKLGAAAIVVESAEAGGHLGTDKPLREIFPTIRKVVSKVPLIAAGGITDGFEMAEMMDKYGADGVQIASRFVLSKECSVSQEFKETYLRAHEQDIINVQSPVGMTGRAITTDFIRRLQAGEDVSPEKCKFQCLKKCSYKYCINDRLVASCNGDVDNGLVFCGANTYKINEILPVKEIFRQFVNDAESVYKENI